ncbi:MAG: hypothetical protein J6R89_01070 [Clostridia bacterium]|nr:hypothetical protein [Clostridia bacterium]
MELLKQIFPFSFGKKNDVVALVINILIYVLVDVVFGFVLNLVGKIPVIGLITGIVGWIGEIYLLVGIILSVLDYCKLIK